jgi:DNA-binding NtrC family response regulator
MLEHRIRAIGDPVHLPMTTMSPPRISAVSTTLALPAMQVVPQDRAATLPRVGSGAAGSILVLDDNSRVPQWFRDHFGHGYDVAGANSSSVAMDALERHAIGVIVTGETVGGESTLPLLCRLKAERPALMAVLLMGTQDPGLVVRLIDEAKVCRVLFRPVKADAVELALAAAMTQHRTACAVPAPACGGMPARAADAPAASLLGRIRSRLGWQARS